ncbi:plastoglobulin-1, chloroplastic [Eucalyptus grandis]|uniref:Uncharacterized protein n=2 Tax=Eucalyptus grandis TaxID=71139 RepID=A0ACC3L7P2_EUCGR|nr:plastoglobulin-1, chloroplastic [Eucalyptus grandis]KAK3434782.1 hypothetical protein EUGRSUZ_D02221 [Eucalyptus grandis]
MALFSLASQPSSLFSIDRRGHRLPAAASFPVRPPHAYASRRFPPLTIARSSLSSSDAPEPDSSPANITDEWGEKAGPEAEAEASSYSKLSDSDPPRGDDEWGGAGGVEEVAGVNGTPSAQGEAAAAAVEEEVDKVGDLKRALVDTVYGTDFGFRSGQEVRAEVLELVNQLEAANPTPAPVDAAGLLDGNWVLVYTASSELLPLLAAGSLPLLKVEKISQSVDTSNLTIVNSTTLSSPFATLSFSASAAFEIRSPSRIQVEFKEGTFQPPEIKPTIDLPESVNLFGQNINLMPVQQSISPLQEAVASLSRAISGQPPLKLPIPGERTRSWLLITYLDKDMRISRGDGGLFVLVKEGSPLLN